MLKIAVLLILLAVGCGETEPPQKQSNTTTPPVVEEPVPQPACFQQSTSPEYPEGISNYQEVSEQGPLSNHDMKVCAETFDCLQRRGLITEEEHQCLIDMVSDLMIVVGKGLKPGGGMNCGTSCAFAGCVRDITFAMIIMYSDDAIRHKCCHIAKHFTTGERGHDDLDWWHPEFKDCVCERVIR